MSRTFLISRTDAIGDVVLTLPVAGRLKQLFPDCRVLLLGRTLCNSQSGVNMSMRRLVQYRAADGSIKERQVDLDLRELKERQADLDLRELKERLDLRGRKGQGLHQFHQIIQVLFY